MSTPVELVDFESFASQVPSLTRRIAERMARRGEFPTPVRFSKRTKPLWSKAAVTAWIADRYAGLEAAA